MPSPLLLLLRVAVVVVPVGIVSGQTLQLRDPQPAELGDRSAAALARMELARVGERQSRELADDPQAAGVATAWIGLASGLLEAGEANGTADARLLLAGFTLADACPTLADSLTGADRLTAAEADAFRRGCEAFATLHRQPGADAAALLEAAGRATEALTRIEAATSGPDGAALPEVLPEALRPATLEALNRLEATLGGEVEGGDPLTERVRWAGRRLAIGPMPATVDPSRCWETLQRIAEEMAAGGSGIADVSERLSLLAAIDGRLEAMLRVRGVSTALMAAARGTMMLNVAEVDATGRAGRRLTQHLEEVESLLAMLQESAALPQTAQSIELRRLDAALVETLHGLQRTLLVSLAIGVEARESRSDPGWLSLASRLRRCCTDLRRLRMIGMWAERLSEGRQPMWQQIEARLIREATALADPLQRDAAGGRMDRVEFWAMSCVPMPGEGRMEPGRADARVVDLLGTMTGEVRDVMGASRRTLASRYAEGLEWEAQGKVESRALQLARFGAAMDAWCLLWEEGARLNASAEWQLPESALAAERDGLEAELRRCASYVIEGGGDLDEALQRLERECALALAGGALLKGGRVEAAGGVRGAAGEVVAIAERMDERSGLLAAAAEAMVARRDLMQVEGLETMAARVAGAYCRFRSFLLLEAVRGPKG